MREDCIHHDILGGLRKDLQICLCVRKRNTWWQIWKRKSSNHKATFNSKRYLRLFCNSEIAKPDFKRYLRLFWKSTMLRTNLTRQNRFYGITSDSHFLYDSLGILQGAIFQIICWESGKAMQPPKTSYEKLWPRPMPDGQIGDDGVQKFKKNVILNAICV